MDEAEALMADTCATGWPACADRLQPNRHKQGYRRAIMWARLPLQPWPEESVACGSLGGEEGCHGITLIELVFIVMILVTIAAIAGC